MVQFAVFAMMQDTQGKVERVRVSTRTGDSEQKRQATEFREIICIDRPFGLKLVVFRERDDHKLLASHLDYGAKVETTFRIGFKCGLHSLFDENNPIVVSSLHFDGHEHYQRNIDTNRIIERLKPELRQYCQIEDGIVVDDRHGKHRQEDAQSKADHEFLQMTDLLIGSFRAVLGVNKSEVQAEVAAPVAGLVKKWNAGAARMKNSRWNRGFCISQCYLENNGWKFDDFRKKDDPNQSCLSLT